ncbi:MAG: hypothetical protein AABY32_04230 [Nanoarchaeota archaeon]
MFENKIQIVGYWNNYQPTPDGLIAVGDYIWPQELISENKIENMEQIVHYLLNGNKAVGYMGFSGCRICNKHLGSYDYTDGTWMWPEKLEHYVSEHNVILPEEFISHMKKSNWQVKIINFNIKEEDIKSTDKFWIKWCKERHEPLFVPQKYVEPPVKKQPRPSFIETSHVYEPAYGPKKIKSSVKENM